MEEMGGMDSGYNFQPPERVPTIDQLLMLQASPVFPQATVSTATTLNVVENTRALSMTPTVAFFPFSV